MTRIVNAAVAALALLLAVPAAAQVRNALDREAGYPAGLALPVPGVAAAEEPIAIGTTPAAVGFVGDLGLAWFREGNATQDSKADGLYLADALGPLGVGWSTEWVRPATASYRKSTLALSLGDGRSFSFGFAWDWYQSSTDPALDALGSWDLGLTLRPWRH